ncbi:substrate-binding domain-containing protein [Egicoccus sp. AB-alg6-2]|uniref:substrate-binding domain-containing protein n=1 Tax=Egicoccus sp. AB-alg6-2 TaxID=3242692 RepID=UPI00359E2435
MVALAALFALVLTGCGGGGDQTDGEPTAGDDTEDPGTTDGDAGEGGDAGPFTIGVSNGFTGSEWRTQMLANIEAAFEEYEEQGLVDELIIESADVDVDGQIQQIRNLVNAGVDAIIINPNSPDALNAAFDEAAEAGVRIYAIDQAVTAESVTNVVIDQNEWAKISARWLAEQVGEGGRVVGVNGIAGHPANEARWSGATEVLEEAGVEIVTQANANWSQSEGATVMADLLAQYGDDIDGVWAQDGVAEGVLRALVDADRLDLVTTGEARAGYMRLWQEHDVDTIGVVNPPGVGVTALRIAMRELQGGQLDESQLTDGNTILLPMPDSVTNAELEEWLAEVEDQPDGYSVDVMLSDDEVATYFQ